MFYPAKILLFGEYGILLGSMGLAIPFPRFSGTFRPAGTSKDQAAETESNNELIKLLSFLKGFPEKFRFIDLKHFENEVTAGLYFESDIPQRSGLGSSGALTAAFYDRYAIGADQEDCLKTKSQLAAIESCFHGMSSGLDPLISLINKPVLLQNQTAPVTVVDLSPFLNNYTLFLINTRSTGNTGELVSGFLEKYKDRDFREKIESEYIPLINQTIGAIAEGEFRSFDSLLENYSRFQLSNFKHLIPPKMSNYFQAGIESGDFHLKLCGSGGGGYLLGISRHRSNTEAFLNLNQVEYLVV